MTQINDYTIPDSDECGVETDDCDTNADCINTIGAYICQCREGKT